MNDKDKAAVAEKQLTPLQELISRMQVAYERGDKKYKPAFEYWINEAKNLLPREEETIKDFHVNCVKQGTEKEGELIFTPDDEKAVRLQADFYFAQTFKQQATQ